MIDVNIPGPEEYAKGCIYTVELVVGSVKTDWSRVGQGRYVHV